MLYAHDVSGVYQCVRCIYQVDPDGETKSAMGVVDASLSRRQELAGVCCRSCAWDVQVVDTAVYRRVPLALTLVVVALPETWELTPLLSTAAIVISSAIPPTGHAKSFRFLRFGSFST